MDSNKKSKYNWNMVVFLTLIPLIGVFGTAFYVYYNGIVWQEPVIMFTLWFLSGMGITMGYHRLFAHKAYKTNTFVEWVLMILGSTAFENTVLKWSSDHRKHHTQAETENDPYSITEGFWHAHIGWILKNTPAEKNKVKGVKDLEKKSAIIFQNKYYFQIGIIVGFIFPLIIGFIYGRPLGAVLWGTFLRITLVHHATFFINSLCHYVGGRTYDFTSTARDSWFVSLFTFGEGYHNYHHKFQWDYRNGIKWFAFDPSKWIIKILSYVGITYDLKVAQDYLIWESKVNSLKDQLNEKLQNSSANIKNAYHDKLNNLNAQAKSIIESWRNMEIKYIKDKDSFTSKMVEKFQNDKLIYQNELKTILVSFKLILSNIKKNQISPSFINS
tara:strand:- start:2054 stop:3208 length:1155 start_codon:yes stop_codon:yes gene_type:complete